MQPEALRTATPRLGRAERAQGMVEYGLILSFASLVAVGGLFAFGDSLGAEVGGMLVQVAGYIRPTP